MTSQESQKATLEARRAVGQSAAPVSHHETAMQRYLSAATYHTDATPRHGEAINADLEHRPAAATTEGHPVADTSPVVVGINGSGCSRQAAEWAAQEATRRQTGLRVVHAYHLPPTGSSGYNPYPPHLLTDLREEGAAMLADCAESLRRHHPDLTIDTALAYGDPATVLRHLAPSAALLVVGTQGGPRAKITVGSVASAIAATSSAPVAVVHPGSTTTGGPVVVGVDGSTNDRAAIEYAFQVAADRGSTLLAVHCLPSPVVSGSGVAPRAQESELLDRELAEWVIRYPQVRVQQAVIHDRPDDALLRMSESAQLIIAGSHGHRRLTSLVLGSTSQALIAQSRCPVVIARPRTAT